MKHLAFETEFKDEKGFTLVELAVVMIIIGLLIGGVLKGQELISNAQVTSTVAQVKGMDAAISTFQDSYRAFPGDMQSAENRLPNCTEAPCEDGNGNSRLENLPNNGGQDDEELAFWAHLNAADLFSGVNGTDSAQFGEGLPAADLGGGFVIGFTGTGAVANQTAAADGRAGHYVVLRSTPEIAAAADNTHVKTTQAQRFDTKLDDGAPNAGTVRAVGDVGAGAGSCASADTPVATYNEAADGVDCALAIRLR